MAKNPYPWEISATDKCTVLDNEGEYVLQATSPRLARRVVGMTYRKGLAPPPDEPETSLEVLTALLKQAECVADAAERGAKALEAMATAKDLKSALYDVAKRGAARVAGKGAIVPLEAPSGFMEGFKAKGKKRKK